MRECLRLAVTDVVGIRGLMLCGWHIEQLPRPRDVVGAPAIGEETVVADAVKAGGQYVDEKAADELVDGEGHHLGAFASFGSVVLPLDAFRLCRHFPETARKKRITVVAIAQRLFF